MANVCRTTPSGRGSGLLCRAGGCYRVFGCRVACRVCVVTGVLGWVSVSVWGGATTRGRCWCAGGPGARSSKLSKAEFEMLQHGKVPMKVLKNVEFDYGPLRASHTT